MKNIITIVAICLIQFIFGFSVFAQEFELTPRIPVQVSGNKSDAIVKKQSKDVAIGNAISRGNILKSTAIGQLNYSWGKHMSTSYRDRFFKTVIDASDNVIVVGNRGEGSYDYDAVIYKFDTSGNLLWSDSPAKSSDYDGIYSVAADNTGNIYITGKFYVSAFDSRIYSNGDGDIFVAKYSPDGSLLWANNAGGYNEDYGSGIALDENGNVYVVGFFNGSADWNGITKTSSNQGDMFIAKYDTNGNIKWVRTGDVGENNYLSGIGVDKIGNCYVSFVFSGNSYFDGASVVSSSGEQDMFLIKYDTYGNFKWIKSAGGSGEDGGNDTTIDPDGNILIAGYFSNVAQFENKTLTAHGTFDIFAAKYSPSGNLLWVKQFGGTGSQSAWTVASDEKSNCYVSGWFSGTGAFDNTTIVSEGGSDAYLIKYDKNGNLIWVEPTATGLDKQVGSGVFVKGNEIAISGYYEGEMNIQGSNFPNSGGEDAYFAKLIQEPDAQKTVYVNPNLLLTSPQVYTSQSLTFTGKQFSPAGKIDLSFNGPGIINPLIDYSVDVDGNFEYTIYTPTSQTAGKYQVTATDKISGLSTSKMFEVIQNQSTVVDDFLRIVEPNMSKIRLVGDPITLAWEDQVKYNVNPLYNLKHSYKVEYKRDSNNSSGAWQFVEDVKGTNPGYGKINASTSFTPTDAGTYAFRITDNYYPNRSVTTEELVVSGSLDQGLRVEFKWDYYSKDIGSSPEGVAADGVARFYMVVSDLNTADGSIQKVKVTLSDPDGYMAPQFLGKVMFCSNQNDDEFSKEANYANTINAESTSNKDGKFWYWYVAPDDFSRNQGDWEKGERSITATFNITFTDGTSLTTPIKKEIKIVRPPVMLVHGLNSSSSAWDNFHIGSHKYKEGNQFKSIKAIDLQPTSSFDVNASHLLAGINDQASFKNRINEMRELGYACNRVDYICHSMGGSILREAAEYTSTYYSTTNYEKGFVNKLITLDTPHQGSSLANVLDDVAKIWLLTSPIVSGAGELNLIIPKYVPKFWEIDPFNVRVTDAINDLKYIGGKKFPKTEIKSQMIGCGISSKEFNLTTKAIYGFLKLYLGTLTFSSKLDMYTWYNTYFQLRGYESDFMDANDAVVSLTSEFSGKDWNNLPANGTRVYGPMHSAPFGDSPVDSPDVWAKVDKLLNTEINNPSFDYIPATTVPTAKSAPVIPAKQLEVVEDRIKILYPLPNAVYNAGDTINIKLQVDTLELQNFALIFQDQSFFDKPTKPNLEYKLIVSPEYIEGQSISVLGGYFSQGSGSISNASIDLTVKPVGSIIDFNVTPEVFVIEKSKSRRPDYEAIFPNAIAQIGYTDLLTVKINDPNLLAYDNTTNQFKGLAKGSTQATITYKGITKTIFFEIIQYEEPVGDPISGTEDIILDKKDQLNVKVYPNPVTNELTIKLEDNTNKIDFEIINTIGQIVSSGIFVEKIVVPTTSFSPGIYLIKLKSENTFEFKKIVKE